MTNFFNAIITFFENIFNVLVIIAKSFWEALQYVWQLIQMIPDIITFMVRIVNMLPGFMTMTLSVIFFGCLSLFIIRLIKN